VHQCTIKEKVFLWNWHRLWQAWPATSPHAIKIALPKVCQVTTNNINHLWSSQCNSCHQNIKRRDWILHSLSCMALEIPRCTFSDLQRLKTYFWSTIKKDCLKNYLLLHCDESITNTLNTTEVARKFGCVNKQCKRQFWKYEERYMYVYTLGLTVSPPPPTSTLESTLLPLLGQIDTSFYYKPLFL